MFERDALARARPKGAAPAPRTPAASPAANEGHLGPEVVLGLQRSVGNAAVGALLGEPRVTVQREDEDDFDAATDAPAQVAEAAEESGAEASPASWGEPEAADAAEGAGEWGWEEPAPAESGNPGEAAAAMAAESSWPVDAAAEVASDAGTVASAVAEEGSSAASSAVDTVESAVADAAAAASEGAGGAWDEAADTAGGIAEGVGDAASSAWDRLAETARDAASGASDAASEAWDAVAGGAEQVATTAENAATSAWDTASDAASGAWDAATDTAESVAGTVRDTASEAWDGIRSAAGDAWDAVRDGAAALWNSVMDGVANGLETIATNVAAPGAELQSRGLTSDERTAAYAVFEDALNYDPIVLTRGSIMSLGSARTVGNTIDLDDRQFTGSGMTLNGAGMSTLIHELTHVLQFQRGGLGYMPESLWEQYKAWRDTGDRNNAYDWKPLDAAGVPWDQWNVEQQAAAVEDYNILLGNIDKPELFDARLFARLQRYVEYMRAGPHVSAAATPAADAVTPP